MNEYQRLAMRTKKHWENKNDELAYSAMGLAGESGEVVDIIKKHFSGSKPLDAERKEKVKRELGDVLWYVACFCDALDFDMTEVAKTNIEKLSARHGSSYSGYGNRTGNGE